MEAESRGLRERAWRAGSFSHFLPGFFGADLSGHQRSVADRAVDGASGTDAAVCVHGRAGIGAGLCGAVFHRAKGRGSFFSPKDRSACTRHPALGGTQWLRGNVDCGAPAAANAVQILCVCGGVVSVVRSRVPGDPVWRGRDAVSGASQAASDGSGDRPCSHQLYFFSSATKASGTVGRCELESKVHPHALFLVGGYFKELFRMTFLYVLILESWRCAEMQIGAFCGSGEAEGILPNVDSGVPISGDRSRTMTMRRGSLEDGANATRSTKRFRWSAIATGAVENRGPRRVLGSAFCRMGQCQ